MSAPIHKAVGLVAALVGVSPLMAAGPPPCPPAWTPGLFGAAGTNGTAYALTTFDDGGGPAVYAGGGFTIAGNVLANQIARWDLRTERWSPLGDGLSGTVLALAVYDDGRGPALYAGGSFQKAGGATANCIARWDGAQWSALGSGLTGGSPSVFALCVYDDGRGPALYAGGSFTTAGGSPAAYIARWDGAQWSALGDGLSGTDGTESVYALTVFDDGTGSALYAGGVFQAAEGLPAGNIARWKGSVWSPVGGGTSGPVRALTSFDDGHGPALFAGGSFATAGGVAAKYVARWDGAAWAPVGGGTTNGAVHALAVVDAGAGPALYAGGQFSLAGGVSAAHIAKWDGTQWAGLGSGLDRAVYALTELVPPQAGSPVLYVGGTFKTAGGTTAPSAARCDLNRLSWSALGTGMDAVVWPCLLLCVDCCPDPGVYAATSFDDGLGPALYVGGEFRAAGASVAAFVARWKPGRPGEWLPTGTKINGPVYSLAVFDPPDARGPMLCAGGRFAIATPFRPSSGFAIWTGTEWSIPPGGTPSPAGVAGRVYAMTTWDDGTGAALYIGGRFSAAGSVAASNIVRWDGTHWSPLGSGVNGDVRSLGVYDDGTGPALYAGGSFTTAGGAPANRIARWNGSRWSPLGNGVTTGTSVLALAAYDDGSGPSLYAGGSFSKVGDVATAGIARWDGLQWSGLGGLTSNLPSVRPCSAYSLAVFDDGSGQALYVGGDFSNAGGVSAWGIVRWNGSQWAALGSGLIGGYGYSVYPPYPSGATALTVHTDVGGAALYAGGRFLAAGGSASPFMARWGCQFVRPDMDRDGDVDLRDFKHFQACFEGPNRLPGWSDCNDADFDRDADVDYLDFTEFRNCFNGTNRPPACE